MKRLSAGLTSAFRKSSTSSKGSAPRGEILEDAPVKVKAEQKPAEESGEVPARHAEDNGGGVIEPAKRDSSAQGSVTSEKHGSGTGEDVFVVQVPHSVHLRVRYAVPKV